MRHTQVFDIGNTAAKQPIDERPCLISGDDDLDDRVISALLGTTAGINDDDTPSDLRSQVWDGIVLFLCAQRNSVLTPSTLAQTCHPQPHRRRGVFEWRVEYLCLPVSSPEGLSKFPMFASKVVEEKSTDRHA